MMAAAVVLLAILPLELSSLTFQSLAFPPLRFLALLLFLDLLRPPFDGELGSLFFR
jgi:hypothetical protein